MLLTPLDITGSDPTGMGNNGMIINEYNTLLKLRWGKRWLVSTTSTVQTLMRLQHTRRWGKPCQKNNY